MTSPAEAGRRDTLSALLADQDAMWRTFVVPTARVMYVQINKNACTSLKWMIADLAGEDPASFAPTLKPATSEHDDIHDRSQWKKVPRLNQLAPEELAGIHPDNGWFIFAVLRDPRSRMFSAWQNKLLLENPGYRGYRNHPWYPRHPLSAQTIVEDFATFVELFEREPDHRSRRKDGHFRDQVSMLHEEFIPYSKLYDIREIGAMRTDLQAHLDAIGWTGKLQLPRINDTPLPVNGQPFANGIRERIEKMYAADFERFGDRWDFERVERLPDWTVEELREAEWRAAFGRRIGYLRSRAIDAEAEVAAQRKRAKAEAARARKLKARVESLQQQVAALEQQSRGGSATRTVRRIANAVQRRVRRRGLS